MLYREYTQAKLPETKGRSLEEIDALFEESKDQEVVEEGALSCFDSWVFSRTN